MSKYFQVDAGWLKACGREQYSGALRVVNEQDFSNATYNPDFATMVTVELEPGVTWVVAVGRGKFVEKPAPKPFAPVGTVSHGTLRVVDLAKTFADLLETCMTQYEWFGMMDQETAFKDYRVNIALVRYNLENLTEEEVESADGMAWFVNEYAPDALTDFCPPYVMFGSHVGDGSDFGFWPDVETLQEDMRDAGEDFEYRVDINDHGNVTLYAPDGREYWSVV